MFDLSIYFSLLFVGFDWLLVVYALFLVQVGRAYSPYIMLPNPSHYFVAYETHVYSWWSNSPLPKPPISEGCVFQAHYMYAFFFLYKNKEIRKFVKFKYIWRAQDFCFVVKVIRTWKYKKSPLFKLMSISFVQVVEMNCKMCIV